MILSWRSWEGVRRRVGGERAEGKERTRGKGRWKRVGRRVRSLSFPCGTREQGRCMKDFVENGTVDKRKKKRKGKLKTLQRFSRQQEQGQSAGHSRARDTVCWLHLRG